MYRRHAAAMKIYDNIRVYYVKPAFEQDVAGITSCAVVARVDGQRNRGRNPVERAPCTRRRRRILRGG